MAGFDATNQQRILFIGDSKTYTGGNTWPASLVSNLNVAAAPSPQFGGDNPAQAATTAAFWAANIGATLATEKDNHVIVLYNIGVNDFGSGVEAQWIADVLTVADAVKARWPDAVFYIMRPWKRGFNTTADTYAGWIDQIVAARTFIILGPDERVWLKGSDDGATITTDGIHYSAAGETECAVQWQTVLGF